MRLLMIRIARFTRSTFWRDASTIEDSATPLVMPGVLLFGGIAALVAFIDWVTPRTFHFSLDMTSFEFGGAALGALLVLRTNEGIGRWWEARKLWGGITNQCRNLATAVLAYGPVDPAWRSAAIRWTIVFAHVCRRGLRGEQTLPEVAALIGDDGAARLAEADHMPSHASLVLGQLLRVAVDPLGMDRLAFLQADKERMTLMEHLGGCERILKTPLPRAYSIQIRRFMFLFLAILPFGLIPKLSWILTPLIAMLVAYPLLSLDKIGAELQEPFSTTSLNHLDLDAFTTNIERNLLALLDGEAGIVAVTAALLDLDAQPSTLLDRPGAA